jgi:hypothetical protein
MSPRLSAAPAGDGAILGVSSRISETADSPDPNLRAGIAACGPGFVLAVAKDHQISTAAGIRRATDLAVCLPARAWQQMSAGDGAKGPRPYDWALIQTTDPALPEGSQARAGC